MDGWISIPANTELCAGLKYPHSPSSRRVLTVLLQKLYIYTKKVQLQGSFKPMIT